MNDQELQLALAKMFLEKLGIEQVPYDNKPMAVWNRLELHGNPPVKDTEWLHVCWLIEQAFDGTRKAGDYAVELKHVIAPVPPRGLVGDFRFVNATWQQRAEAILKVKGAAQ